LVDLQSLIKMKTTEYVSIAIDRLPKGFVFTYEDLSTEVEKKEAIIKALNRMVEAGKLSKLAKGKYFKPENTPFGKLQPKQKQVVKDLLEENGKPIGYLTGFSIYNSLGLSTQISNTIQIGRKDVRPSFKRDRYRITFLKQKNTISKENIPLLQLLDAIRHIKKIPDSSVPNSCKRLLAIVADLKDRDVSTMVKLAMKYPPATKALLGAILDQLQKSTPAQQLYNSLNPITKYKIDGVDKVLSNTQKWNIA
jgi:hypothetical protein